MVTFFFKLECLLHVEKKLLKLKWPNLTAKTDKCLGSKEKSLWDRLQKCLKWFHQDSRSYYFHGNDFFSLASLPFFLSFPVSEKITDIYLLLNFWTDDVIQNENHDVTDFLIKLFFWTFKKCKQYYYRAFHRFFLSLFFNRDLAQLLIYNTNTCSG